MTNLFDSTNPENESELLLYQTEDGQTRIQVRFVEETVWLSQTQMSELFQTTKQNISLHVKNIFEDGELAEESVVKEYLTTAADGKRYSTKYYNLDVIISVGYRVRSHRGTQFRQWATQRLREFIIKGFVLDDERLKEGRKLGKDYFDELLARIRDIRSSERRFYQKITDIYATSIDYDAQHPLTQEFFKTVQNKLHWAIHGHTAAELISERADGDQPNMGLTNWKNAPKGRIRKTDAEIAKNYLDEEELSQLNLLVDQYLSFAELQAKQRKGMTMADWKTKLDAFLTLNDREILDHSGTISAGDGKEIADREYEEYEANRRRLEAETPVSDFDKFVERVKKLPPKTEE